MLAWDVDKDEQKPYSPVKILTFTKCSKANQHKGNMSHSFYTTLGLFSIFLLNVWFLWKVGCCFCDAIGTTRGTTKELLLIAAAAPKSPRRVANGVSKATKNRGGKRGNWGKTKRGGKSRRASRDGRHGEWELLRRRCWAGSLEAAMVPSNSWPQRDLSRKMISPEWK